MTHPVKAALLVGGPLDGKGMEVAFSMKGYMQLTYDAPQLDFDFSLGTVEKFMPPRDRPAPIRIAVYREQPDGTHWMYTGEVKLPC